jgi:hypothetical protein
MTEEIIFHHHYPKGEHRDILIGPQGDIVWERPWQSNLIVNGLSCLLAGLLMGGEQDLSLTHWAVGAGNEEWDSEGQPSEDERRERTTLFHETARMPISPGRGINFFPGELSIDGMTEKLEIIINLTAEQIQGHNKQLREFGLFAKGEDDLNSGVLINHRIHPLIEMKRGFTLQRTLRLTFYKENSHEPYI